MQEHKVQRNRSQNIERRDLFRMMGLDGKEKADHHGGGRLSNCTLLPGQPKETEEHSEFTSRV